MQDEGAPPPASPVDIAAINASVASLRADMHEVKAALSVLAVVKGDVAGTKADMTAVMTDVVRLEQKFARMAGELSAAQADIQKILELMATKNDVERILGAIDALARKR